MKPRMSRIAVVALAAGVVALLLLGASDLALAAKPSGASQTAQGVMVNLHGGGSFTVRETNTYQFNVATAGTYYINAWDGNTPTVSTRTTGGGSCTPAAPTDPGAPAPDAAKVTGPNGIANHDKCTFLDGGTLSSDSYTQTATASTTCTDSNGKTKTRTGVAPVWWRVNGFRDSMLLIAPTPRGVSR